MGAQIGNRHDDAAAGRSWIPEGARMTPIEVRARIQRIRDLCEWGDPSLMVRYAFLLDVMRAIAEDRCVDPQTCAREIVGETWGK